MPEHEKINYLEFPSKNITITKKFFSEAFGWEFVDYGADYVAFFNAGLNGGFFKSEQMVSTKSGSVLVVIYSLELEKTRQKIEAAGGQIIKSIFEFPGGRRFHFADPNGNEYAVWSDR